MVVFTEADDAKSFPSTHRPRPALLVAVLKLPGALQLREAEAVRGKFVSEIVAVPIRNSKPLVIGLKVAPLGCR